MRRRSVVKRELTPDVKYDSKLVARLINTIMERGKKATAQRIVYDAFDIIQERKPETPAIDIFMQALENVKPKLEVKTRRVGGANYQVPIEVEPERQVALAMRWIATYSRGRKGKSISFLCEYGAYYLPDIEELLGVRFNSTLPPEEMLKLPERKKD